MYVASHIFNFACVVFILWYFCRKPAREFLKSRSVSIKENMKSAETAYAAASESEQKWQSNVDKLQEHRTKLKEEAETMMQKLRSSALEQAEKQAERIESDSKRIAQSEVKRAKQKVQDRIVEESLQLSKQFLEKSLGQGERKKLVLDSLELVGKTSVS